PRCRHQRCRCASRDKSRTFYGSVQESGKPRVFRGFWTFVKLAHPSSSRCGNVETRVLCGFPSSGGPGMNLSAEYHQSAPGASFPQRGPSFSRNWRLLTFPGHLRPRCAPLRKPRNMHVFTDSRSEPFLLRASNKNHFLGSEQKASQSVSLQLCVFRFSFCE